MRADAEAAYDESGLRNGERLLWVGAAASVLAFGAIITGKHGIGIACLVASWLGGVGGIYQVVRAGHGNRIVALLAMFVVFTPLLNLLVISAYLMRARRLLRAGPPEIEEASPTTVIPGRSASAAGTAAIEPSEAAAKPSMDWPANWSPARARHELASAIAMVKHAGLAGADGTPIPDGAQLAISMKLPDGEQMPEASQPAFRASRGTFGVFYAFDRGQDFIFVTRGDMAKAGLTLHELHAIGLRNLARQVNGAPGLRLLPQEEGHFGLVMGGHFEASLVLLDELWDVQLKEHIPNGAIVGIPARDMCVFCDSRSRAAVAKVHEIVKRVHATGDHVLSDKLFLRKDGQWRMLGSG